MMSPGLCKYVCEIDTDASLMEALGYKPDYFMDVFSVIREYNNAWQHSDLFEVL